MNRDDIIRMAREAEAWSLVDHDGIAALERFAHLVAAAEREACAKVCEDEIAKIKPIYSVTTENALKAIRERGAP
jgi:hypothetical protein